MILEVVLNELRIGDQLAGLARALFVGSPVAARGQSTMVPLAALLPLVGGSHDALQAAMLRLNTPRQLQVGQERLSLRLLSRWSTVDEARTFLDYRFDSAFLEVLKRTRLP
jgi:hypothetical protein